MSILDNFINNLEPLEIEAQETPLIGTKEERAFCFTASEVSPLMSGDNTDGYKTYLYTKAMARLGYYPAGASGKAIDHGNRCEPKAISLLRAEFEILELEQPPLKIDGALGATIDLIDSSLEVGFEIKSPHNPTNIIKYLELIEDGKFGAKKKEYYWQLICQFAVYPDLKTIYFCLYIEKDGQGKVIKTPFERGDYEREIENLRQRATIAEKTVEALVEKYGGML